MPKQGSASMVLADCGGALRLCLNILIVKGQVPSLQQRVIRQLRHVQCGAQSDSPSGLQCS